LRLRDEHFRRIDILGVRRALARDGAVERAMKHFLALLAREGPVEPRDLDFAFHPAARTLDRQETILFCFLRQLVARAFRGRFVGRLLRPAFRGRALGRVFRHEKMLAVFSRVETGESLTVVCKRTMSDA